MMSPLAWTILAPLSAAVLAYLLGRRLAPAVGVVGTAATLAAVAFATLAVVQEGPGRHPIGGWGAPLGIDLYADGLSALMLALVAVVCTVSGLYALRYFQPEGDAPWSEPDSFWPLWLFLWASLNALFLSADIFNLYVALELLTLAAVALVVVAREPESLTAAMRYLLAAFLGSLAYLLGVAFLYASFHTLDLYQIGQRMGPGVAPSAAAALVTVGLALKTALFPLHFWLPQAHAGAPGPVSAALSALVVKASFYLLLRLWVEAFPGTITAQPGQLLGWLGAAAIVWGSVQAIRQERLKLLIAHSTVAQIGYLFLMVPLLVAVPGGPWQATAWSGGIYHVVAHGLAKASMFLAAGAMMRAAGNDDHLSKMGGFTTAVPLSVFAFGLAGLNLIGAPPSAGFVAKWFLLWAALDSGQWWWAVVIGTGGLLAMGYLFRVLRQTLLEPAAVVKDRPAPRGMELSALALAVLALLFGLRTVEPLALLEVGSPFPWPLPAGG